MKKLVFLVVVLVAFMSGCGDSSTSMVDSLSRTGASVDQGADSLFGFADQAEKALCGLVTCPPED